MTLTDVPGIGPAIADKLTAYGIWDEQRLAAEHPRRVAEATGRSLEQAQTWIDQARHMTGDSGLPVTSEPGWQQPDPTAARKDGTATVWHVILGLDLAFLGFGFLATLLAVFYLNLGGVETTKASLWAQIIVSALLFGVIPFLWVLFTRVGGWQGAVDYLRLRATPLQLLEGAGYAVGLIVIVIAIGSAYSALFGEPEVSPVIESLTDNLDWLLVLGLAITAGVGEEILFRGVLQRWIGVWGQGVLFGLAHAGYDTVLNVAVPFAIGILFGYVYKWRRSLWIVIVAHFLYDFILLGAALLYPEAA